MANMRIPYNINTVYVVSNLSYCLSLSRAFGVLLYVLMAFYYLGLYRIWDGQLNTRRHNNTRGITILYSVVVLGRDCGFGSGGFEYYSRQ